MSLSRFRKSVARLSDENLRQNKSPSRRSVGLPTQVCLEAELAAVRACRICRDAPRYGTPLAHEPRPVLRVSPSARILVAGQAPGKRVHASGQPFTDPSGERLRAWMGVSDAEFYDLARVSVVPMGFCFPGYDAKGADLPPRRECAATWHDRLFAARPPHDLVLAVGQSAQRYHLARLGLTRLAGGSLTETVGNWRAILEGSTATRLFALPHPSWRNNAWLKKHPWFERELLPVLRADVRHLLASGQ
jgi:uracil-DNA glycosylase